MARNESNSGDRKDDGRRSGSGHDDVIPAGPNHSQQLRDERDQNRHDDSADHPSGNDEKLFDRRHASTLITGIVYEVDPDALAGP